MISRRMLIIPLLAILMSQSSMVHAEDALHEVNQLRASRGLPPFQRDDQLSQAAQACANFRAQYLVTGHTQNDFAFVPHGAQAQGAGCAAWPTNFGWGSCYTFDHVRFAGAAYAMGRDGRRYMHLFVSNAPNGQHAPQLQASQNASQMQVQQVAHREDSVRRANTIAASEPGHTWEKMDTGWIYWNGQTQVGFLTNEYVFHRLNANGTFSAGQRIK